MKSMYKQKLINTVLFYIITIWSCIEYFNFPTDSKVTHGSMLVSGIIGGILTVGGIVMKGIESNKQKKKAAQAEKRKRKLENQYQALQDTRQEVIDQSDSIRALKSEVFNPYANLGVAMQATNMKLEQGDEDLANILQSINQSGGGGGAATQLARMASISKAQAAAGLEQQEVQNQKLRLQGEAQMMSTKLNIEQMAIQEEVSAWGRQEGRDIQDMNRVERLENQQENRSLMHEQQRSQMMGQMGSDLMGAGQTAASMGMSTMKTVKK